MEEENKLEVPRVKLGNQGLEVSRLEFGCQGLTGLFYAPAAEEAGINIIKDAVSKGVTFFDTADFYGGYTDEVLVGKALKDIPREKVQIASKFGIVNLGPPQMIVNGTREYVRSCCEISLKRLNVDYMDLYYQHRVDTSVPIEETMGELKKLVDEGKIKYLGLSEASPDTIRKAHAVHPVSVVQMEWSLWTRDIEEEIVPLCRELGIGIVVYSPLGCGFFADRGVVEPLPEHNIFLANRPRHQSESLEKNKKILSRLENISKKHGCTPAQLALSWILHQGNDVVPIPGTTKIKNLDTNLGSLKINLTEKEFKEVSDAVPLCEVAGDRTYAGLIAKTWKFADTLPLDHSQI